MSKFTGIDALDDDLTRLQRTHQIPDDEFAAFVRIVSARLGLERAVVADVAKPTAELVSLVQLVRRFVQALAAQTPSEPTAAGLLRTPLRLPLEFLFLGIYLEPYIRQVLKPSTVLPNRSFVATNQLLIRKQIHKATNGFAELVRRSVDSGDGPPFTGDTTERTSLLPPRPLLPPSPPSAAWRDELIDLEGTTEEVLHKQPDVSWFTLWLFYITRFGDGFVRRLNQHPDVTLTSVTPKVPPKQLGKGDEQPRELAQLGLTAARRYLASQAGAQRLLDTFDAYCSATGAQKYREIADALDLEPAEPMELRRGLVEARLDELSAALTGSGNERLREVGRAIAGRAWEQAGVHNRLERNSAKDNADVYRKLNRVPGDDTFAADFDPHRATFMQLDPVDSIALHLQRSALIEWIHHLPSGASTRFDVSLLSTDDRAAVLQWSELKGGGLALPQTSWASVEHGDSAKQSGFRFATSIDGSWRTPVPVRPLVLARLRMPYAFAVSTFCEPDIVALLGQQPSSARGSTWSAPIRVAFVDILLHAILARLGPEAPPTLPSIRCVELMRALARSARKGGGTVHEMVVLERHRATTGTSNSVWRKAADIKLRPCDVRQLLFELEDEGHALLPDWRPAELLVAFADDASMQEFLKMRTRIAPSLPCEWTQGGARRSGSASDLVAYAQSVQVGTVTLHLRKATADHAAARYTLDIEPTALIALRDRFSRATP